MEGRLGDGGGRHDRPGRVDARDPEPRCCCGVHRVDVGGGATPLSTHGGPTAALDKVEAILRNPATYAIAAGIPPHPGNGRPRTYPDYMGIVFAALLSVWRTARQVEAELAHPQVWDFTREIVEKRFPDEPAMHLPAMPMRRHHFVYLRDRYLRTPEVL